MKKNIIELNQKEILAISGGGEAWSWTDYTGYAASAITGIVIGWFAKGHLNRGTKAVEKEKQIPSSPLHEDLKTD
ncbi:hypothetical protein GAMM_40206 [Gammaproteobacteria bacterium]